MEASRRGASGRSGGFGPDGFEATGPALAGDRLSAGPGRPGLRPRASPRPAGRSGKLDLTSPVASLRAAGPCRRRRAPTRLRGRVDLAALAKMIPRALRLRDGLTIEKGTATVRLDLTLRRRLGPVRALREPRRPGGHRGGPAVHAPRAGPAWSALGGEVGAEGRRRAAGGQGGGRGRDGPGRPRRRVKLEGTVDLAPLDAQVRDLLDLGDLRLSGHARLAADYRHDGDTYKARFVAEFRPWTSPA